MRLIGALAGFLALISAPAAAHEFLIYFPAGRMDLPDRYRRVISDAACWTSQGTAPRLVVVADADPGGEAAVAQRLSAHRADAVAQALVAAGVAREAITTEPRGGSRPAVHSSGGRPEPLNRRAVILASFEPGSMGARRSCPHVGNEFIKVAPREREG